MLCIGWVIKFLTS